MHAFSVAPFDQNLSIDGKILSDDCATLGTLGVIPESVILLKVGKGSLPEEVLEGFGDLHPRVNYWLTGVKMASGPRQGVVVSSRREFLLASGFSGSG